MKEERNEHPELIWTPEDAKKVKYFTSLGFTFMVGWIAFLLIAIAPSCPNKKSPEYYYGYGKHFMEVENDFVQAQRFLTRAIKEKPRYFEAYEQRAKAWEKTDSLQNAINDYDTLLTFKNLTVDKTAELYFLKANNYYLLSEDTLACHNWKRACDFNHNKSCDFIRKSCK